MQTMLLLTAVALSSTLGLAYPADLVKLNEELEATVAPVATTSEIGTVDDSREAPAKQRSRRSLSLDDSNVAPNNFPQTSIASLIQNENTGPAQQRDDLVHAPSKPDNAAKSTVEEIGQSSGSGPSNPLDLLAELGGKMIQVKKHILESLE
ncbi:uncharacterized protein LOC125177956 [Hyalella azteca]|uniref:Uncharacterized protein LOC125177956 n=1 Tax=Hyalella azteca TaxID=294128 RepID=A0A979FIV5_HYAAZ|nr:uncharacterized protein LOC125177956 [Hyalella azteca]